MIYRSLLIIIFFSISCSRGPEGAEAGDCKDGLDNDNDGKYDCEDDGCLISNVCVEQARQAKEAEKAREKAISLRAKQAKAADIPQSQKDESPVFEIDGLLIQRGENGKDITWSQAEAYCKHLNLAGKTGWRLPDENEALQIVNSGKLVNQSSYVMWTSVRKGKSRAVIVGITSGAVNQIGAQSKGQCRARCVR